MGELGEVSWSSSFSNILLNLAYFEVVIFLVDLLCGLIMVVTFSFVDEDFECRDFPFLEEVFTICLMISGL